VSRCAKCGRDIQDGEQYCPECIKKLEDEVLSRRGVSKHVADIPDKANAPIDDKDKLKFKNKVVTWVILLIVLGIAIGLLIYFYLGILNRT